MIAINSDKINHLLNFWKLNPQFQIYSPFSKLYKSSKDEEATSKLMWFIVFMQHPDEELNIFFRIPTDERQLMLERELIKPTWDDIFTECFDAFPFQCLTAVQRALQEEINVLVKRSKLIKETDLTLDSNDENGKPVKGTATQINTLQKDAPKVYQQYEELYNKFIAEKQMVKAKGGSKITKAEDDNFWNTNN